MDQYQKIKALFQKYLNGQCSGEELDLFFKYVKTQQGKQILNEFLDKEATDRFYRELSPDPEISGRILHQLRIQMEEENQGRSLPGIFKTPAAWRIAATFTGILLISASLFLYFIKDSSLEYQTAYGEITTVLLPDSSSVTLNANSSLRYADGWKPGNSREVWIKGEAYFSVKHTIDHQKFIVHTHSAEIEVLGTTFNVNNRRKQVAVVLNTGKIRLKRSNKSIKTQREEDYVMNPGDFVSFSQNNEEVERKKVNPEQYISWTRRKLIFDDTPVADIIQSLEDNLGMKIEVEDESIKQYRYSGTISIDDVDIFFQTLSKTLDIIIVKDTDHLIIKREKNDPGSKDATP